MRVWAAIGWLDYEGYDEPICVFSTEELARDAAANCTTKFDGIGIFEYVIDTTGSLWKGPHPSVQ